MLGGQGLFEHLPSSGALHDPPFWLGLVPRTLT